MHVSQNDPQQVDAPSARVLPRDGLPTKPSEVLQAWRSEGAVTPLVFADGHEGWVVTDYDVARAVLEDARFSQLPMRMPVTIGHDPLTGVDDQHLRARSAGNLLFLDGSAHSRMRRTLLQRFSLRAVRAQQGAVSAIVEDQLEHLLSQPEPVDIVEHYAVPISARVHAAVLGIPEQMQPGFFRLFLGEGEAQEQVDYARELLRTKSGTEGDDPICDLLTSDLTEEEIEGLTVMLLVSGRDSVAYMISTSTVALLTHRDQWELLRSHPELLDGAVEELIRFGAMFVTLFPRTATEDVLVGDVVVREGQTVAVSQVAANRDPGRFPDPDALDLARDAYGQLGFGHGIHGCVGQQLARLEVKEALKQLIERVPELRLVDADQLRDGGFASPLPTYEAGAVHVAWSS